MHVIHGLLCEDRGMEMEALGEYEYTCIVLQQSLLYDIVLFIIFIHIISLMYTLGLQTLLIPLTISKWLYDQNDTVSLETLSMALFNNWGEQPCILYSYQIYSSSLYQ